MDQIEKTFVTSKLVSSLQKAAGIVTPQERYQTYQEATALIAVLLKNSKPLDEYRRMYPSIEFRETPNGIDVFHENANRLSRAEAISWRNQLLADGLGELSLFRVWYIAGGFVEYVGESDQSKVIGRITADYSGNWKVFRADNMTINLVRIAVLDVTTVNPGPPTIDDRIVEAEQSAESLATTLKERYPFEVIIVRIPFNVPVGSATEIRVVKR